MNDAQGRPETVVRVAPGPGIVCRRDRIVAVLPDEADIASIASLIGRCADAQRGQLLAELLAGMDTIGLAPGAGVAVAVVDDEPTVVLFGAARCAISTPDGSRSVVDGTTRTVHAIPAETAMVELGFGDLDTLVPHPHSDLTEGTVPGAGAFLDRLPAASAPIPEHAGLAGTGNPDSAGVAEPARRFVAVSLLAHDEELEPREPLPLATASPGDSAPEAPRPVLGRLTLEDGTIVALDMDHVIGREPTTDAAVRAGTARALTLDDPDQAVSRVHAEVRVADADVFVIDRASTHGTYIHEPGASEWTRLSPGIPHRLVDGSRIAVSGKVLRFEHH
jgi:hypothetical protein